MSSQGWVETLLCTSSDGPALTAAARASCMPTADALKVLFPSGYWAVGRAFRVQMSGRISCVVTTPGTARLDICLGSAGTTIIYDTGALNLNTTAKTNVPWYFDVTLVCRAIGGGTSTTFFPLGGAFQSEAVVGSAAPTAGGNGSILAPTGAPAVGAGTSNLVAHAFDVYFTQTVATGSFTVHNCLVQSLN